MSFISYFCICVSNASQVTKNHYIDIAELIEMLPHGCLRCDCLTLVHNVSKNEVNNVFLIS